LSFENLPRSGDRNTIIVVSFLKKRVLRTPPTTSLLRTFHCLKFSDRKHQIMQTIGKQLNLIKPRRWGVFTTSPSTAV